MLTLFTVTEKGIKPPVRRPLAETAAEKDPAAREDFYRALSSKNEAITKQQLPLLGAVAAASYVLLAQKTALLQPGRCTGRATHTQPACSFFLPLLTAGE